jgi:hypothetical protein
MNPNSTLAKARLECAAQAKDKIKCTRWLMLVGAVGLLALLTFAVLDYWLLLPKHLRHATSALLALVAVFAFVGLNNRFRSPTSLKEAALDAESLEKENDCVVSTAAEYASGKAPAVHAYEPELASALQTVAAQRLGTIPMRYRRTLRGPLATFAMSLAALVFFVAVTPGAWTALKRVALPWLGSQYTQVEVKPQNAEVRLGHSLDILGRFTGRPPKDPRFHWQAHDDPVWKETSMTKSSEGAFVHALTNVTVPVKYRVSGGDALSPEFLVSPYLPPEVKHLSIGLTYPEYTKLKPLAQSAPDITILRGSTATVHVRANVDLSRARLRFSDTNMAAMDLQKGENDLWSGSVKITRNSDYSIELFDQKGRRGDDDTSHHIVATADALPRVEILEPAQDMRADATNTIPIRVSVADDYGVDGIKLVYHKLNAPERSVMCQTESVKNGEWLAAADLNLATLGLTRYDVVAYYVEAKDNNTMDGPGVGRSLLYFIEITDKQSGPTPPPPPMPGEQINLLVVQKQIIADTVLLDSKSAATNHYELALRQTNAVELGRMYLAAMSGALPEAVTEMNSAIASMEQAIVPLNKHDSTAAIPLEEAALAHLYRVLALMPDVKMLAVKPKPQLPKEQKPQTSVALREIKKPNPDPSQPEPEIEEALQEARELSRAQAALNALGQKLVKADRQSETPAGDQSQTQPQPEPSKGDRNGNGQGEGQGKGEGTGVNSPPNPGGVPQLSNNTNTNTNNVAAKQLAKNTNNVNFSEPFARYTNSASGTQALAQAQTIRSTNSVSRPSSESTTRKPPSDVAKRTQSATNTPTTNAPRSVVQFAQLQNGKGEGTKPGKGRGTGKGKGNAAGQKGKGKGQGTKPGIGSGQPSTQQKGELPEMAAHQPDNQSGPDTPEELAEKQEELSAEAKALGEMLRRLAGKGTRVGHNLVISANQAAEHMEGAAMALKQGNASGAGRRGTQSSEELQRLVTELERLLGKRPDLVDVASEEAPKEYEAFIAEYFRRLSYEK